MTTPGDKSFRPSDTRAGALGRDGKPLGMEPFTSTVSVSDNQERLIPRTEPAPSFEARDGFELRDEARDVRCACGEPLPPVIRLGQVTVQAPKCTACMESDQKTEAQTEHERRVAGLLARAGAGSRWRTWTLATYPDDPPGRRAKHEAMVWLHDYARGRRRNLILWGAVGAGKSGLAWALVRFLCERGHEATIVNWRDLLADVRHAIGEGDNAPPELARAGRVPVLALDDLGAERSTDFALETLAVLVERRYQGELPTIVTTNYDPKLLQKRLGGAVEGARIVSRLLEGAQQVRLTGPDRRRT